MWTRRAFAGLIAAGAAASASAASPASRRSEAAALRAFAETTHPRGRDAAADGVWRAGWDDLLSKADSLDLTQYLIALRQRLAWFQDGHTNLLPFEFTGGAPRAFAGTAFALDLPVKARAFDDGLWIVGAGAKAADLLGARVTRIGALSDVEMMRRFARDWPGNAAWAHNWGSLLLSSAGLAHALGAVTGPADAPIPVQAVTADGRMLSAALKPRVGAHDGLRPIERPPLRQETWTRAAGFSNHLLPVPESKALYLSIDAMEDQEGRPFLAYARLVLAALDAPDLQRVVIDLRRNGGGDNFLGEGLRKHLERSRFNRPGGIVVLIGPQTFSAAQNLASRLERETFASFVGGPTGGAPNHFGDARPFSGEVTGVTAIVSSLPWFDSYPMDRRPWIAPDLAVPETFADWAVGRDPALDAAFAHRFDDKDDDLSARRVFQYERPSQAVDWKPFWRA